MAPLLTIDGFVTRFWNDDSSLGAVLVKVGIKSLMALAFAAIAFWLLYKVLTSSFASANAAVEIQKAANDALNPVTPLLQTPVRVEVQWKANNLTMHYRLVPVKGECAKCDWHRFFDIELIYGVPQPRLVDSIDVLTRRLEYAAFNDANSDVRLCAETRQALDPPECEATGEFRKRLVASESTLQMKLRDVQLAAMILGPVQFIAIFLCIYALLDTLGLAFRWVTPRSFTGELGAAHAPGLREALAQLVGRIESQERVGVADRFLLNALAAAGSTSRAGEGASPANDAPDVVIEPTESERAAVRSVLRNFRDHLLEDAAAKQESLEMLADTVLKVAFFGTVLGIGHALFTARLLDAADPLERLSAKSLMYGGIGIGFGATMVGIILSIIAAKGRSWLQEAWSAKIESGYRYVSALYERELFVVASSISVTKEHPPPPPQPPSGSSLWKLFEAIGGGLLMLVVTGVLLLVAIAIYKGYFS